MPINNVIREKRKEIGLTQEQLADYLGVSAPAVNKWEKGTTYPDISLLPALARLLKVDMNTLMCFHEGLTEQEIASFSKEAVDTIKLSGFKDGFDMLMEKIQEYPNCSELIHTAALLLDGSLLYYGAGTPDREYYEDQITALYERAAKGDDEQIREKSCFMLVSKYIKRAEYDKAQELIDLMPDRTSLDKRNFQAQILINQNKLTEAATLLERKLIMEINALHMTLMSLMDISLKENNLPNAVYQAEVYRQSSKIFDLWDYNSYIAPLELSLNQKNIPDSVANLKAMLAAIFLPWDMKSSPLYCHIGLSNPPENAGMLMLSPLLAELETNPRYEFLRTDEEYTKLLKQYRAKCPASPAPNSH